MVPARSYDFGLDWKFILVNADGITDPSGQYAGACQPGFDDSGWQSLDLPHDWSVHLNPVATGNSGDGFSRGGLGWYRKTFTLPSQMAGKRIWIEFDGVYANPQVYVNGQFLGNHPCGYTGFGFDLTSQLHTDATTPNVVAVQVTNQVPGSRWYSGSGIYRNVHLIVTGPVAVARHGTFVTTPGLPASGAVRIATDVRNDDAAAAEVTVGVRVLDAAGQMAGAGGTTVTVPAGQAVTALTDVMVEHPELWSTDNPVLYSLETGLRAGGGTVDATTTTFGFRYTSFDPDAGFSLNGKHLKLQGVNLHATQGPLGAVILPQALERQVRLMKSMGANALRTAHNPPAPELTAVCERLGIVMLVEAFDCWHTGKLPFDYHLYFDQWSGPDITEMVLAHRNSPAVVAWSIGNETPDTGLPGGPAIVARLVADVKSADSTRPVVMGSEQYRSVPRPGSPQDRILAELDGLGVNYNTAKSMDGLHAAYPGKFFFCSETSSQTSTRGSYQRPDLLNTGEDYTPGQRFTSSYDNNLASWTMSGEYELKKDRDRLFWQGGFVWSGQDYTGEPTPYDVFPVKSSFFAPVDTAGLAKDAYHLYRSQWSAEPMVHIVPMDWTSWTAGQPVAVWVYSNAAVVELFLNGRSLGRKSFDAKVTTFGMTYLETTEPANDDNAYPSGSYTSPNGSAGKLHLTWSVPFEPGRLEAVAYSGADIVARDVAATAGPGRALRLDTSTRVLTADGKSVAFVTASVVDDRGVVVPSAEDTLSFRVTGAGILAGTDNGRQENAGGYQSPSIAAFRGLAVAIVRATSEPGPVRLTVTSPGLAAAAVELRSQRPLVTAPAIGAAAGALAATTPAPAPVPASSPSADASYSGAPDTIPAMMLDGDPATGWSNFYRKPATANLPAVSSANASEWVSLTWPTAQHIGTVTATFVTGGALALPATVTVSYWTGHHFTGVSGLNVSWATASGQPTTLTFDPVTTTRVRLGMTSPSPATPSGFLRITALAAS